jgi:AcrR family transcriptional regulator
VSSPSSLDMFPPNDGGDLASFWLHFDDQPDPPNRRKLLLLTMREVALVGPATFNTMGVCDVLDISYPMVNYYFGNRDGLIAEAGHLTYLRYVQKLWDGVEAAPRTPRDRLLAWMHAHLRLNVEIRGWGAVLNYPRFSATIEEILDERFGAEHRRHFELNMARLTRLILDVRDGVVSEFTFTVDDFPREALLADDDVVRLAATISWATLGLAVWRSGRHTPSKGIPELEARGQEFIEAHFSTLLGLAEDLGER